MEKSKNNLPLKAVMIIIAIAAISYTLNLSSINTDTQTATQSMLDHIADKNLAVLKQAIQPAIERTHIIENSGELHQSLKSNKKYKLTEIMNKTVKNATEIDIVAVFNGQGKIQAINTIYHDQSPVPQDKIDKIMKVPFEKKARFIKECLNNENKNPALEFQTTCKLTSTYYDATGIAVAYSLPVIDKITNERIGVISTRMRFERIVKLLGNQKIALGKGQIYFITDNGGYFDEKINNKSQQPPIAQKKLAQIMDSANKNKEKKKYINIIQNGKDTQVGIYKLDDIKTLSNGGISLMYIADQKWINSGLQDAAFNNKLKIAIVILISLCLIFALIALSNKSKQTP